MPLEKRQLWMIGGGAIVLVVLVVVGVAIRNVIVSSKDRVRAPLPTLEQVVEVAQGRCREAQDSARCFGESLTREARGRADAKLCETLEGSALESCVRLVAQDTKDVSHCRRLDGDGQTRCEDDVLLLRALADSDKALCERVHDDALRARCAENVTAQIVRAGRCEELHVEKKLCDDEKVIQAAVDRADVTFCETLEEPAQGDCLERVENALNADIDEDGLSRAEEIEAGTDVSRRDTDGDGLSDGEELHVFASNPLRTDTDGDSFEDGEEVENGYSPTGGGRL